MMQLFLFVIHALSKKPIVIVPSHFGSRLYMNTTNQPFWYCPKSEYNKHAWIRLRDIPSPFLTCLLNHLTVDIDESTNELKTQENTSFSTLDFGGVEGILGIGPEYFGRYLPVNYELYIETFLDLQYEPHKSLFSAPYDWRFGLEQPESYFIKLQRLIESAYELNSENKVAVLAHGLGASLTHIFLTENTTEEWRKKYIDSATYISPMWSGSGQALFATWKLKFPFIHIKFDSLTKFVASMGAFHATIPNSIAYANSTLLVGPDGRNYTGAELLDVIRKHGKLDSKQLKIAEKNFKYTNTLPKQPDFHLNIIYNSGVKTPMGIKLKDWNDKGMPIYGRGDSLVGSKVIEWACDYWGTEGVRLRCHDAFSDDIHYHHRYLLKNAEIVTLIKKWIVDENYDDVAPRKPKKIFAFQNEL
ncbi:Lecithin:cholesterol acyltransferase family protein [Tritrichomonas foetus]|uniref:Lecithin:cholesterol acyltransferase family protein n=1 Tax=Tritrichomonas foetus TaxID=1144522 RepID=A0A1J4KBZ5_9EUKA|nr:Lecithin:cholesterol acyltransferase family protein [Tritrichomonas foetus]|eukprot:OHT08937.1 Lecithin:cholesterol acyltransferase family protein [Tritrichomonas foetus]